MCARYNESRAHVKTRIAVSHGARQTGQRRQSPAASLAALLARKLSAHAVHRQRWPHGMSACVRSASEQTMHSLSSLAAGAGRTGEAAAGVGGTIGVGATTTAGVGGCSRRTPLPAPPRPPRPPRPRPVTPPFPAAGSRRKVVVPALRHFVFPVEGRRQRTAIDPMLWIRAGLLQLAEYHKERA